MANSAAPFWMIRIMIRCIACLGFFPTAVMAAEPAGGHEHVVAIDQEPSHRSVLKNDTLRVFDVSFAPGDVSLWHSHDKDSVLVCLDGADVPSEEPGQPRVARPPIASGSIYYRPYASHPFVHRIRNAGLTEFRILDIEVLRPAAGKLLSTPYQLALLTLENERVRVLRVMVPALASTEWMRFEAPHLTIAMSAGQFELKAPEGDSRKTVSVRRGDLHMTQAPGPQAIRNLGHAPLELVIVEIK